MKFYNPSVDSMLNMQLRAPMKKYCWRPIGTFIDETVIGNCNMRYE